MAVNLRFYLSFFWSYFPLSVSIFFLFSILLFRHFECPDAIGMYREAKQKLELTKRIYS